MKFVNHICENLNNIKKKELTILEVGETRKMAYVEYSELPNDNVSFEELFNKTSSSIDDIINKADKYKQDTVATQTNAEVALTKAVSAEDKSKQAFDLAMSAEQKSTEALNKVIESKGTKVFCNGNLLNEMNIDEVLSKKDVVNSLSSSLEDAPLSAKQGNELKHMYDELYTMYNKLKDNFNFCLDKMYPIGSIYINCNNVSPAGLFGGTWQPITDRFLLAVGNTYNFKEYNNGLGGYAQMQNHSHTASVECAGEGNAIFSVLANTNPMPVAMIKQDGVVGGASFGGMACTDDNCYIQGSEVNLEIEPHTHSININSSGGGASFDKADGNLPPFMLVYVWKRVE